MYYNYDREAAVDYAKEWALRSNPKYNITRIKKEGESASFVSQCLYHGSGVMNKSKDNSWFYENENSYSKSWYHNDSLILFLLRNKDEGPHGKMIKPEHLFPGDVVHMVGRNNKIFTSAIVATIENNTIYVCAHNFNSFMRPLFSYSYKELICMHVI